MPFLVFMALHDLVLCAVHRRNLLTTMQVPAVSESRRESFVVLKGMPQTMTTYATHTRGYL